MSNVQFYTKPVAVNREIHRNTRIGPVSGYGFAAQTNSVHLTGVEFLEACKHFPVIFARIGTSLAPFALLGLRDHENLFVDSAGRWTADYIPAFVRRYPFVLAEVAAGNLVVCIDESSEAFNSEAGQPLFDADGNETPFLTNAVKFLGAYQEQMVQTNLFAARLEELGLLVEKTANAQLPDGRKFNFNGLLVVDEQKLLALNETVQMQLLRSGELALIFAHLISLSNVARLANLLASRKPEVAQDKSPIATKGKTADKDGEKDTEKSTNAKS